MRACVNWMYFRECSILLLWARWNGICSTPEFYGVCSTAYFRLTGTSTRAAPKMGVLPLFQFAKWANNWQIQATFLFFPLRSGALAGSHLVFQLVPCSLKTRYTSPYEEISSFLDSSPPLSRAICVHININRALRSRTYQSASTLRRRRKKLALKKFSDVKWTPVPGRHFSSVPLTAKHEATSDYLRPFGGLFGLCLGQRI